MKFQEIEIGDKKGVRNLIKWTCNSKFSFVPGKFYTCHEMVECAYNKKGFRNYYTILFWKSLLFLTWWLDSLNVENLINYEQKLSFGLYMSLFVRWSFIHFKVVKLLIKCVLQFSPYMIISLLDLIFCF